MSRKASGLGSIALVLVSIGLTSCGGGGGGGGGAPGGGVVTPPPPPPPTFTSWSSDLKPGTTVNVPGRSQEVTVTGGANGVTSISAPSGVGSSTFTESFNSVGAVTNVQIAAPNRTISFNSAAGDAIGVLASQPMIAAISQDRVSRVAIAAEPTRLGWNYQSFGVWLTTDSATTGSAGAVTVGAATAATAIPTSGSTTFSGKVGALYLDTSGIDHMVASDLTITTNFANRSATFASGTMVDVFESASYAGTAISGTLAYAPGQNTLSGALTTANGRLSGTATGQFYGPAAQEIGGIFILTPAAGSASKERLGGGFGAKQ